MRGRERRGKGRGGREGRGGGGVAGDAKRANLHRES